MAKLVWKEGDERELLRTRVLKVCERKSISPRGEKGAYIVLEANDWVVVVPVVRNNFLMVKQWRHASKSLSIEFPGGVIDTGETPRHAAMRELLEETGYKAKRLTHIGTLSPNPAIMANAVHFFVAENVEKVGAQDLDADEFVEVLEVSQKDVREKFGEKLYSHAIHAAALALFEKYKRNEKLKQKNCKLNKLR